jgi:hypothetical protein
MNGLEEWTEEEKSLPKISSRPFGPVLKSQQQLSLLAASSSMVSMVGGDGASIVSSLSNDSLSIVSPRLGARGVSYMPSWAEVKRK